MQDLVRIALVGTAKSSAAGGLDDAHPCAALVAQLGSDDREQNLLLRAGAQAVFEQCGRIAAATTEVPEPCPAESWPVAAGRLANVLQDVIAIEGRELFGDFLAQLEAAKVLLPPELLPQALGIADASIRHRLLPVLGQRGRWLARFNLPWAWAAHCASDVAGDRAALRRQWDEGNIDQRCQALQMLRHADPADARSLLPPAIAKEKPEHRIRLIRTLEVGLTADDEPLLESLLDDRSEQVRRAVAAILARLPGSALARRMQERADAMLALEKSWLKRKRLACNPPQEIDPAWIRDGVPAKPPPGRGKRAVWAQALLAAVAPSHWTQRFATEPARLIELARNDDFAESLLGGWSQAAVAFAGDPASAPWLPPLWDHWASLADRQAGNAVATATEHLAAILAAMTPSAAEAVLLPILSGSSPAATSVALGLLPLLPHPWSPPFALAYLRAVRQSLLRTAATQTHQWVRTLAVAARAIPQERLADALASWEFAEPDHPARREIDKFLDTIHLRQTFCTEVARIANP